MQLQRAMLATSGSQFCWPPSPPAHLFCGLSLSDCGSSSHSRSVGTLQMLWWWGDICRSENLAFYSWEVSLVLQHACHIQMQYWHHLSQSCALQPQLCVYVSSYVRELLMSPLQQTFKQWAAFLVDTLPLHNQAAMYTTLQFTVFYLLFSCSCDGGFIWQSVL